MKEGEFEIEREVVEVWHGGREYNCLVCASSLPSSLKEKALFILQATFQHARNLAFFTAIYRALLAVLARCLGGGRRWHTFVAAFVSGYVVFGKEDKVNTQVSGRGGECEWVGRGVECEWVGRRREWVGRGVECEWEGRRREWVGRGGEGWGGEGSG